MNGSKSAHSTLLFSNGMRNPSRRSTDPDFQEALNDSHLENSPFIEGVVVKVYPRSHTADVSTNIGTLSGVRIMAPYISPFGGGDTILPEPGASCIVCIGLEIPVIMGFVSEPDTHDTDQDNLKLSTITTGGSGYGGDDPTYDERGGTANHRAGRPDQAMPGDRILSSAEGNLVGAMRGYSILKGGELSQIIVTQLGGLVRVVSNIFHHIHAGGEVFISNESGRTNYRFTAGSTSNEKGDVLPQLHVSVGADGGLVDISVTEDTGTEVAKLHVSPTGEIRLFMGSSDSKIYGDSRQEIAGSRTTSVSGTDTVSVDGKSTHKYMDGIDVAAGSATLDVQGKLSIRNSGDRTDVIAGKHNVSVSKETKTINTSDVSRDVVGGDYRISIGASGVNIANFSMQKDGTIDFTSNTTATIGGKLSTRIQGASVDIGQGAGLPVIRNSDLQGLIDIMVGIINTFAVVAGPKVTITIPPGVPNPYTPLISGLGSKIVRAS